MTGILYFVISKIKEAFSDYKVKTLIDEAFSAKPSVKVLARAKLKKDYPDVYEQLVSLGEVKQ